LAAGTTQVLMDADGSACRLPLKEVLTTHGTLFSRRPMLCNELVRTLDLDGRDAHPIPFHQDLA
jgi:hypothetical protein